ncbi:MAG: peptidoglycan-binding protein [Gammaproteobacteria bacterium]|nr:peptidoglycan-binding protein [Gammaproteobacteria bacterium]
MMIGVVLVSMPASAADAEGKFAVKGAGTRPCSDFVTAKAEQSRDYYLYGGWLEGFVSSFNQFQADTYDVTPWQTTELLLALLETHCRNNPDQRFLTAANALVKTLLPARLAAESAIISSAVNGTESYYYQAIVERVQERLQELGHYRGEANGELSEALGAALRDYQAKSGLRVTGIPDQYTLANLFLKLRAP